jgi:hypothetical protein
MDVFDMVIFLFLRVFRFFSQNFGRLKIFRSLSGNVTVDPVLQKGCQAED